MPAAIPLRFLAHADLRGHAAWRASSRHVKGLPSYRVRSPTGAIDGDLRHAGDRKQARVIMSASEATSHMSNSFFSASLADSDPEIARAIELELGRQRDEIELIASENIVSPRRARGAGLGDDQQIRRGLSGPALLRRLPVRRYRREARHRARLPAVRLPLRQRAAQFRQPGQPGGVHGADEARRHLHGPRSRLRRPSHPRLARQHVGQVVQRGQLRRAARTTSSSTWTKSRASPTSTSRR